jgi:hypothetical protein
MYIVQCTNVYMACTVQYLLYNIQSSVQTIKAILHFLGSLFMRTFLPVQFEFGNIKNAFSFQPYTCAGIFKQSMKARNRVGIGLSYRPARARIFSILLRNRFPAWRTGTTTIFDCGQPGYIGWLPRNRFLSSLNVLQIRALAT